MIKKQDFLSLYDKLINKVNDTYKEDPNKIKSMIYDEISDMPFFKTHTDLYGIDSDDAYVWAFHHQGAPKTLVLFNQYGEAADCCGDNTSEAGWTAAKDWMSGLTIHLAELQKASVIDRGVNLLFLSIPISKTGGQSQSKIMKRVIRRLVDFKTQFDLTYEVVLLSEPQPWKSKDHFTISTGFAGKMMPIIATKGMSAHVNTAYKGLNAISIANEVIKAIELNTEMSDAFNKRMTPPPAFIDFYSVKSQHALSTPQYTISTFNWHFLKDDLNKKLHQLKELCAWSVEDAINQFNYSYNEYLRKQALPSYRECMYFDFEVVYVESLKNAEHTIEGDTVEEQMVHYMDAFKCNQPVVLIGMLDAFYPVVSSAAYFEQKVSNTLTEALKSKAITLDTTPYHLSTSGVNLFKKSDTACEKVLANMPVGSLTLMDVFQENVQLNLEVLHVGPRTREEQGSFYHLDVVETVPELIDLIIATIK